MAQKRFLPGGGIDPRCETAFEDHAIRLERLLAGGLCGNCRHHGDCAFLGAAAEPVVACELHECGLADRPRLRVIRRPSSAEAAAPEEAGDPPLGLCSTCEELRGCRLPRPLGGVWQCEEYR